MAGFFLVRKDASQDVHSIESQYRAALDVFSKKGVRRKATIVRDGFVLFVYDKTYGATQNLLETPDGHFAVTNGTMFYNAKFGNPALQSVLDEFDPDRPDLTSMYGQFALLVFRDGELHVLTDPGGMHLVYASTDGRVLSNSFLAVAKSCPSRTLSEQELYEYLTEGGMYGDRTLIKEVVRLDSDHVHQFHPSRKAVRKIFRVQHMAPALPFEEQLELAAGHLLDVYRKIQASFGDNITSGLSGGYDSRLAVAIMRYLGMKPDLYVYGPPDSSDVTVAIAISQAEKLGVRHCDQSEFPIPKPEAFPSSVDEYYHFTDGIASLGVFSSGVELHVRRERARSGRLQTNLVCGEVYRNFWVLPDRPITAADFVTARYDAVDWSWYRQGFDRKAFLERWAEKIAQAVGLKRARDTLQRHQVEELFLVVRARSWLVPNNMSNGQLSYSLMPFTDPHITVPSYTIPFSFKEMGFFETKLIQRFDSKLAPYMSTYGYNLQDPFPLRAKLKNFAKVHTPVRLRPMLRRRFQADRDRPAYYDQVYLDALFGSRPLAVREFMDDRRVWDMRVLNRLYTVELLIRDLL
jgi:asparagine synthase (glutamine-hydrolysing)